MEHNTPRKTSRYTLAVDIQVTDVQSGIQIGGKTSDVSLFGCCLKSLGILAPGAIVNVNLCYRGEEVIVLARVIYVNAIVGMGFEFTRVERRDRKKLERWIVDFLSAPVR